MADMRRLSILAAVAAALPAFGAEGLIQLIDPLDEPQFYCVDVPGFRNRVNLDAPLMAHTCKPGAADELFTPGRPEPGQFYMRAYDRCAEAASAQAGASLSLAACGASKLQRFALEAEGRIKLAGSDLCLAVADGKGTPTGGPSHLRRDLTLEPCGSVRPSLSRWKAPSPD